MKELVVISGKGGTGKTSIVASFAALADSVAIADCDVDAADLHLVLAPKVIERYDFHAGVAARVLPDKCTACGRCAEVCRFDALSSDGPANRRVDATYVIDPLACEGCGVCHDHCDARAIELTPDRCGEWFLSETRCGPLVHAKLGVAAENSGKLVTKLRQETTKLAESRGLDRILCDGSPGIGCPVIASLTGASLALVVVEPTLSGLHDFERVAQLTKRLGAPALLAVNKADLHAENTVAIEALARRNGIECVGRVPYDADVTRAQIDARSIVEYSNGPAATAIRDMWTIVLKRLDNADTSKRDTLVQLG